MHVRQGHLRLPYGRSIKSLGSLLNVNEVHIVTRLVCAAFLGIALLLANPLLAATITERSAFSDFKEGKTTSQQVKTALGDAVHEDHNPDGRYVYLYQFDFPADGDKPAMKGFASFLFSKENTIIRIRFYEDTK